MYILYSIYALYTSMLTLDQKNKIWPTWWMHKQPTNTKLHSVLSTKTENMFPVDLKRTEILDAVKQGDELVIVAETGAWKSTRVPQFLYEAWYNVIITQPRVLAAVSLARHVAEEVDSPIWDLVWYHTGWWKAENRKFSDKTNIKYCTDWLQLVKQLVDNSITNNNKKETVLIIDEVHEWNKNIEVLIAWVKKMKAEWHKIKVICMSATLDAEKLQDFLSADEKKCTRIEVEWRLYPVVKSKDSADSIIDNTADLVAKWRNVLIFQPWKKEIDECISDLKQKI